MKLKKKKILIISPLFPYPLVSGGQVRIYNIIKHLSDHFEISLLSPIESRNKENISEIKQFCHIVETFTVKIQTNSYENIVSLLKPSQIYRTIKRISQWLRGEPFHIGRFYHPTFEKMLDEMILKNKYDIVQAVYCQMAPYLVRAKELDKNIKSVLVDIELSFISKYREYLNKKGLSKFFLFIDYKRMKNYVSKIWPRFDNIIVMSEVDKEKLLALKPELNVSVVPNGVDINYFQPLNHRKSKNKLAFLGGSLHYPNVDALLYFNEEIFPIVRQDNTDISLTVIGEFETNLLPKKNNHICFTGFVEDFRSYLSDCDLLVVPLRIGGGTRLKILEAMALGIPVVSTTIGSEGIEVQKGKDIIIADTAKDFADSIITVLRKDQLRQSLAKNGRHLVEQKYQWQKITGRLEEILNSTS